MKIAVATTSGGLDDQISPVFGRCQTFTIVEADNGEIKEVEVIQNESASSAGGAGIRASQLMVEKGVDTVIAGNFGPNSATILKKAGIKMVQTRGNVKEILMKYLNGDIKPITTPTVGEHFGIGYGMGRGGGRGMGYGRRQ
ncbi:MAG: dinitrogenase iron-molybdenum cofactor [Candidatus Altiarchaeales archaeon]|nr:MAG: dinitrogenase iron-molybdenum cofactor [Candidatus Altiarchaeales archaeon]RLI93673.1 MAG: dinitrogenase iron-molybdenum cofactor [Candidatus Altiarchaeales archaeon]RLI94407.1 MAG: dinitrogenase iron-molybdenum cofactor [Candidatus Altiarchaeales archaeon]HDO81966.1 dinitrogenase iron-molybdenum cofactor [Candidatus Altiarchaeales archaeon]HEX54615.1 dinitrogenase iron-molybdenum cofactor [Candidatus Altiarchaeales archaeon]